jgi:hypothetical protein
MTNSHCMTRHIRVSLALLLLAASGATATAQTIGAAPVDQTRPPKILFAEAPAVLILIDGDPVYRVIDGTDLERIVNTSAQIIRDSAGIHYLRMADGWLQAYALTGDWSVSGTPPGGIEVDKRAVDAQGVAALNGGGSNARLPSLASRVPTVFVSSEPAELIVTDGPARYQRIDGTSLESLVNTTASVFREPTDQEIYVLLAGRWFRSWRTNGPWEFVPSAGLPSDIANRPPKQALPTTPPR